MPQPTRRLVALDGMRGVAAFVVMIYHASLVARPHLEWGDAPLWTALTQSPLKLLTAGTEAVLVFFVLSGLVVALPALRQGFDWARYYPSRLLRLYLPVWAALAFTSALILAIPRNSEAAAAGSWLVRANATDVSLPALLGEGSLMLKSYDIDNVLWSLRWEIVFSLTLPAFVMVARLVGRHWLAAIAAAAALGILGRLIGVDALVYLPVFFFGTLMAVRLQDVVDWAHRPHPKWLWPSILIGSALLLVASWLARPLLPAGTAGSLVLWGLAGPGAAGLILAAVGSRGLEGFMSGRIPQWLGKISFSLYLVHVPVLATLAFVIGDSGWWLVTLIGLPLSLVAGWAFFRWVETPSHRLARKVQGSAERKAPARQEVTA